MSRSKVPLYLGVAAAGGVGYYLYTAGGSPSAAAKQAKIDAKAFPNKPTYGRETGAKIDEAAHEAEKVAKRAEEFAKGTKNELLREIDKADQKIEETAKKAKGWFGSGNAK
ncbi:uncharacterized protein DNG_00844 [Cephalotrichum gorgonifer]|uniref:Calcofluor white hypersensitive protein n=1 Tax=Cephalotrichum gorgonifer TaxID=2041049 RepID=A0AAE8SRL4_9PEZI|nr:uncharacterized protein DNG_00844 [Cephalotrichum gorgonifer]